MTHAEIISRMRRVLQEDTVGFYSDESLKINLIETQREIVQRVHTLLPVQRTFASVISQKEYAFSASCGLDIHAIERVGYGATEILSNIDFFALPVTASLVSTPTHWYLQQNAIGFYPTPAATGDTIYIFGYRMPPRWGMSLYHSGAGGITAATYAVAGNVLTLVETGGATNTYALTAATHDTAAELVASVNALATGWTMAINSEILGTEPSANLEAITTTSAFQTTANLYENPELPIYAEECLKAGALFRAFQEDGEDDKAGMWLQEFERQIDKVSEMCGRRRRGFGHRVIQDIYSGGQLPSGAIKVPGGYVVVV